MSIIGLRDVYEEAVNLLPAGDDTLIMDHGCGDGGSRSLRVLSRRNIQIVGADRCAQAIEAAREAYPSVRFLPISDGYIDLGEGLVDGAFSGFCLNEAPTLEVLGRTVSGVQRVLKPGAPFVVLTLNPGAIGLEYPGYTTEAPQGRWNGAPIISRERGTGRVHRDFFWDKETYEQALASSGFGDLSMDLPLVGANTVPPFLVISCRKLTL